MQVIPGDWKYVPPIPIQRSTVLRGKTPLLDGWGRVPSGKTPVFQGLGHVFPHAPHSSTNAENQPAMKTTLHSNTTLAGTLSRAASHLRSSVARRTAPATPRSHSTLPAIRPAGLRAAFTATLAVLLLAVVPGKMAAQVIGWGDNSFGQTTVPAGAQSGVTAIGAGRFHTVALKSDGSVVAWGDNSDGQTTVPAGALLGVTAIAAGSSHTVALKSDGSVLAWGSNSFGLTTVPAGAQSGVTAIAAGELHIVAIKSDGSVIAWGSNAGGQTTDRKSVV